MKATKSDIDMIKDKKTSFQTKDEDYELTWNSWIFSELSEDID